MEAAANHIYLREVDPNGIDSLSKIARRIVPGSRVLDLGCGPGALGRHLVADKQCVVDGVELNADAANLSRRDYRKLVVGDLETLTLAEHFGGERYDYIVCADILEHVRQPERVLTQLASLLAPAGRIIVSIPNIGYVGVVAALMRGEFSYRAEGLLDDTHVRFYTRKSLLALLGRCGLHAMRIDTVAMPLSRSEFADDPIDVAPSVMRALDAAPDASTYQFIVEASPTADALPEIVEQREVGPFGFVAQLFHRCGNATFDAAHCATANGRLAVERQRLRFVIAPSNGEPSGLRLDPADRPGYLRLYGMTLADADGTIVWKWISPEPLDAVRTHELSLVRDDKDGLLAVLEGDDPGLELPVPPAALASLRRGGTLEVELSWPESSDSVAVIAHLLRGDASPSRLAELSRMNDEMREHIRTLSREIKTLQDDLRAARRTIAAINNSVTFRVARPLFTVVNKLRGK